MKKINFKKINNILLPILVVTNIGLFIQINSLPKKISESLNVQTRDTVEIVKHEILQKKKTFIYYSGTINDYQRKIIDNFEYNPEYPDEYWNGWLTLTTSKKGGNYFVWTKEKIGDVKDIEGWFLDGPGLFHYKDKEFLPVLIPIVERNKKRDE